MCNDVSFWHAVVMYVLMMGSFGLFVWGVHRLVWGE